MQHEWDTLIRGGLVIDGTGTTPVVEDIAVQNGMVAARGQELNANLAGQVVDATGRWVMPGLLDIHTHLDLEIEVAPSLEQVVRHGTTTVLIANCSLGIAFGAQRGGGEDPIVDCFARVENIPKRVLSSVVDQIDWSDTASYLHHLDRRPLGANVIPMIPHSMLRAEAMGLHGSVTRKPGEADLAVMRRLLVDAMDQGYVGMSTDSLPFHYLSNDPHRRTRIPSQWCSWDELKLLTGVLRDYDRVWQPTPAKDKPLEVLRTFLLTCRRFFGKALRTTAVAVMDMATNRSVVPLAKLLTMILNSRLLGGRFYMQALAAEFRVYWDGPISPLAEEIDVLRELNELDLESAAARRNLLADPDYRKRFRKMWMRGKRGFTLATLLRLLRLEAVGFSRRLEEMVVYSGAAIEWAGESMADVHARLVEWQRSGKGARSRDEADHLSRFPTGCEDEVDFVLHLFEEYDLSLRWTQVSANRDPKKVEALLFDERFLPGFNDCGAHLTNLAFNDANLCGLRMAQAHGLAQVARHVHRLTRLPAEFLNVDAGRIDVGAHADVIVIDPVALASHDTEAGTSFVWRDDIQNEQIVKRSDGVVTHVWVAGALVWTPAGRTGVLGTAKVGRVLRSLNHEPGEAAPRWSGFRASGNPAERPEQPTAVGERTRC